MDPDPSLRFTARMRNIATLALPAIMAAFPAGAEDLSWGTNTYGMPGLIDMPHAHVMADGDLTLTSSHFIDQTRHTLAFQITPRLTGSFRYALLYGVSPGADGNLYDFLFDRSFSLQYLIASETDRFPALAFGLNDFLGTGIYSAEYLVATRTFGDNLRVSGGIGWGRLAGVGSFDNPLSVFGDSWNTRPGRQGAQGGQVEAARWLRGPAAFFGGIEWRPNDDWTLVAEYSSDAYPSEAPYVFDRRSPFNFGLRYRLNESWTLGAQYLYGSELGVQVSWGMNPAAPRFPSGRDTAPPLVRGTDAAAAASWGTGDTALAQMRSRTRPALAGIGLTLHGLTTSGTTARVEIVNDTYPAAAQAIGRAARALTATLPPAITTFDIVLIERGLPVTQTTIRRADLEELEFAFDGAWGMQARSTVADAGPGTEPLPDLYPRLDWGIEPYLAPALFDPDAPFRADIGLDLSAAWEPVPGLIFSGILRQPLAGNLDESTRASTSVLPRVRSDAWLYDKADTRLSRLTGAYYFRPGENLYGRVTAGLLEPMFGGVSAELLWSPPESRLALGAEIAHVVQRDYDQLLEFRDYEVTTGHISAYWDMGRGYEAQIDLGRYLAGDWGATLSLDRTFGNGWRIGAFATLTDVPFAEFGEGSFDKGIRVTVPISWINGAPTRDATSLTIRPVLRDGGARLDVDGRLYETVNAANGLAVTEGWGRFWR